MSYCIFSIDYRFSLKTIYNSRESFLCGVSHVLFYPWEIYSFLTPLKKKKKQVGSKLKVNDDRVVSHLDWILSPCAHVYGIGHDPENDKVVIKYEWMNKGKYCNGIYCLLCIELQKSAKEWLFKSELQVGNSHNIYFVWILRQTWCKNNWLHIVSSKQNPLCIIFFLYLIKLDITCSLTDLKRCFTSFVSLDL